MGKVINNRAKNDRRNIDKFYFTLCVMRLKTEYRIELLTVMSHCYRS